MYCNHDYIRTFVSFGVSLESIIFFLCSSPDLPLIAQYYHIYLAFIVFTVGLKQSCPKSFLSYSWVYFIALFVKFLTTCMHMQLTDLVYGVFSRLLSSRPSNLLLFPMFDVRLSSLLKPVVLRFSQETRISPLKTLQFIVLPQK